MNAAELKDMQTQIHTIVVIWIITHIHVCTFTVGPSRWHCI